jgi:hypothetical protein
VHLDRSEALLVGSPASFLRHAAIIPQAGIEVQKLMN